MINDIDNAVVNYSPPPPLNKGRCPQDGGVRGDTEGLFILIM